MPLPAFLQSLSNSMAQRTSGQAGNLQNRSGRKNQAQSKGAMVGIIIWVIFIIISMLMTFFAK
jgi:hypothetical protein